MQKKAQQRQRRQREIGRRHADQALRRSRPVHESDQAVGQQERSRHEGDAAFERRLVQRRAFGWLVAHSGSLAARLERFPIGWNHPIDKKSLQNQKGGASSYRKSLSTFSELALDARADVGA
jgi:hypothetical protein